MTEKDRKEYKDRWRKNNPEKVKEHRKKYYETHKEQYKEYQKKWNEKNKEKIKEMHHNYYLNHKEEMLKQNKEWCKKNKDRKIELINKSRRKRAERLRARGCINPWSVISKGSEPKYRDDLNE